MPADPERNQGQHSKNQKNADDSELPDRTALGQRELSASTGFYIAHYKFLADHYGLPCARPPIVMCCQERKIKSTHFVRFNFGFDITETKAESRR